MDIETLLTENGCELTTDHVRAFTAQYDGCKIDFRNIDPVMLANHLVEALREEQ